MKAPLVVIRPILDARYSVNHNAPSGPGMMTRGELLGVGTVYSVTTPAVVMRPILLAAGMVNHSASSGPRMIPKGWLSGVGRGNLVRTPAVVIRPIHPSPVVTRDPVGP